MYAHVCFYQRRALLENKGGTLFTLSEALSLTPKCALSKWWTGCIWILIKRGVRETSIVSNAKNNKKNILPKSFRVACVFRELLRRKTEKQGWQHQRALSFCFATKIPVKIGAAAYSLSCSFSSALQMPRRIHSSQTVPIFLPLYLPRFFFLDFTPQPFCAILVPLSFSWFSPSPLLQSKLDPVNMDHTTEVLLFFRQPDKIDYYKCSE